MVLQKTPTVCKATNIRDRIEKRIASPVSSDADNPLRLSSRSTDSGVTRSIAQANASLPYLQKCGDEHILKCVAMFAPVLPLPWFVLRAYVYVARETQPPGDPDRSGSAEWAWVCTWSEFLELR